MIADISGQVPSAKSGCEQTQQMAHLFDHCGGAGEQGGGQIEIERVSNTRMNIGICPSLRKSIKIAKID